MFLTFIYKWNGEISGTWVLISGRGCDSSAESDQLVAPFDSFSFRYQVIQTKKFIFLWEQNFKKQNKTKRPETLKIDAAITRRHATTTITIIKQHSNSSFKIEFQTPINSFSWISPYLVLKQINRMTKQLC